MDIGPNIKARRATLNLTLADLAERSGVSKAMLCDVECGKKNPTIRIAAQIAHGLGCTISDLLDAAPTLDLHPHRRSERRVLVDAATGAERHLLAPALVQRGLNVVLYILPPRAALDEFPPERTGVIEHITVLKGRLREEIAGAVYEFDEGDSMTFPADVPRTTPNPTDETVEFLLVMDSTTAGGPAAIAQLR